MKGRIPAASGRRGCQTGAAGAKDRTASGTSVHGRGIHAPMSAHWAPAPWRNRPVVRTSSAPTHPHTNAPGHHCATIPPRTCVTAPPWCAAHAHCTLSAHPAAVSAALAAAPQARPPNAHSRPQTNATDKHITQAPQPGACPWPGLPHAARHLHRASGLPHRRAHAHGPMAAPAPLHPGCAPQRAVGVYTFGLSMGSPGSSTGGASSGGSIGSGLGSWSLLGSLGVVAMGCTSCRRYSATSVVLASAWASKRKG